MAIPQRVCGFLLVTRPFPWPRGLQKRIGRGDDMLLTSERRMASGRSGTSMFVRHSALPLDRIGFQQPLKDQIIYRSRANLRTRSALLTEECHSMNHIIQIVLPSTNPSLLMRTRPGQILSVLPNFTNTQLDPFILFDCSATTAWGGSELGDEIILIKGWDIRATEVYAAR